MKGNLAMADTVSRAARRCALPWAGLLLPHSGRIAKAQRIAETKIQENELLKK